jgi:hypothetical protein
MQADVNLVTTTLCDLKCKFCVNDKIEIKKELMSCRRFKVVLDKLKEAGVRSIDMTPPVGENYIYEDYNKKLLLLDQYKFDFIKDTTNFVHVTKKDLNIISNLQIKTLINVSIYGDTQESFLKFAGVDRFENILKNVEYLEKLYQEMKIPSHIEFCFVIRYDKIKNNAEGGEFLFKNILENYIESKQTDFINNKFWQAVALMRGKNENFKVINQYENNNFCRPDLINESHPFVMGADNYPNGGVCACIVPTILPNGDIVICNNPYPRDEKITVITNIFEDSDFKKHFIRIKDEMRKGNYPDICKRCSEFSTEID